jgi:hypothetical protein
MNVQMRYDQAMSRHAVSACMLLAAAAAAAVAAAVVAAALLPAAARADLIDLGATETIEVPFAIDPETLVRIPPGAFGKYPPGTLAEIAIDAPNCNGPNCINGQGILVAFDGRYLGDLVLPVTVQVHYAEEAVRQFGVAEADLVLARFEERVQEWRPYPAQTIDAERNLIAAPETRNIRLFVAVFAGAPQAVAPGSWGAIKALFRATP